MPDPRLIEFARQLRSDQTDAERRIWSQLRRSGYKFRRQHPIEPYIADFYCHAHRLVVELDGAQHFEEEAIAYDNARTAFFESQGIKVIRFQADVALRDTDAVIATILRVLATGE